MFKNNSNPKIEYKGSVVQYTDNLYIKKCRNILITMIFVRAFNVYNVL